MRILCLLIPRSCDPSLPTRDGRFLSSWDYVVELIPLQVETTSSLPSNSVYNFHIFNQVSNTNPIHLTPILINPNHLTYQIHLQPIRFNYDLSDTNVRSPNRISQVHQIFIAIVVPLDHRHIYILSCSSSFNIHFISSSLLYCSDSS